MEMVFFIIGAFVGLGIGHLSRQVFVRNLLGLFGYTLEREGSVWELHRGDQLVGRVDMGGDR